MANPKFCYPNWTLPTSIVTPTISGAGWIDLPLLQGDVLSEMARFPSLAPSEIVIDLGTTRRASVFAMPFHNAWLGNTGRIRFATDPGFTDIVADSGDLEFIREIYPFGAIPWGYESWMSGYPTPEQLSDNLPPWVYQLPTEVLGRYVKITLNWAGNPAGYVDLGQIVISPAVSTRYNHDFGASRPFYRDPSTKKRAKGGPQFKDKARKFRTSKMTFSWLTNDEVSGPFFEMVREYGLTKPMFFIFDPSAPPGQLAKESFMATLEAVSEPVHTSANFNSMDVQLSEEF